MTSALTIRQRIHLVFHPRSRRFRRACLAPWPELTNSNGHPAACECHACHHGVRLP